LTVWTATLTADTTHALSMTQLHVGMSASKDQTDNYKGYPPDQIRSDQLHDHLLGHARQGKERVGTAAATTRDRGRVLDNLIFLAAAQPEVSGTRDRDN
jgi:hypothetical protein